MAITHPSETPAGNAGAADRVREATEHLAGLCAEIATLAEADLVQATGAVEALGRVVDALRVRTAGEVEDRSEKSLGVDRLSSRYGCRTGSELLERLTGAPGREARRRSALDARTRVSISLTGQELPAKFPVIASALHAGDLCVETAELLTGMLTRVGPRADPAAAALAEAALVATAIGTTATGTAATDPAGADIAGREADGAAVPAATFAEVKVHAQAWEAHLDQDGPDPEARQATARRGLTLGPARDGLIPVRGNLMPETAAQLTRLLSAYLNPAAGNHSTADGGVDTHDCAGTDDRAECSTGSDGRTDGRADIDDRAEGGADGAGAVVVDERSSAQKRHDVLAAILTAAARCAETPSLGGDAATLLVHVNAEDLTDPAGISSLDGIDLPAPAGLAHRIACSGAVQKVVFDRAGRIIGLGSKGRVFTAHQRRAIAARDGGCVIPGCMIPASWCEIHHVHAHAGGGATHTDNGVLLCWWHHHHLEGSGWEIRMRGGVPQIKAPGWHDPTGRFHPVVNLLTRRGRNRRPGPPPQLQAGTMPGPNAPPGPAPGTGLDLNETAGMNRGEIAAPDAGVGGSDASRSDETAEEFATRWDADAGQSLEGAAEERWRRWNAHDDEPPW
ncbi:hypothetical protein BJH93_14550 [Kocuria polaris]|nr:hypothetical protein [Kocuria polaris]